MSIFAVGDLHLSNASGIDKPMDVFGSEWKDHAARLAAAWNKEISASDTVIIAGDISWGMKLEEAMPDLQMIHELPGRKVLIKGNHDLWWTGITKLNSLYDDMFFLQNSCYEAEGRCICGTRGWVCPGSEDYSDADKKIYERELMRLEASLKAAASRGCGEITGVMHFPPTNDKMHSSGFTDLFSEYGVRNVVYGHLHGKDIWKRGLTGNFGGVSYRLISLDRLDCRPLKLFD